MRFALTSLLGLALSLSATAQERLRSTDTELRESVGFLQEQVDLYKKTGGREGWPEAQVPYIKFFTTYAVPDRLRKDCENSLAFVLNSVQSVNSKGYIVRPKRVPGSDTLWYADITPFGWSIEQFELLSKLQPFFAEPLIDHRIYNYGRLISGNLLFRADWFVVYVTDVQKQLDKDEKNLPYYFLQYGIGKEPKNLQDFQKAWRVDIKTIRTESIERGAIINKGDSGVSRHTRQVRRARTIYGAYSETRDVKSHDLSNGDINKPRDFVEDIFAEHFDAGEAIANNKVGLQTYLLFLGNLNKDKKDNFKRVDPGDTTIVVDNSDKEDPRVRTAKSCIVCHPLGLNPTTNMVKDLFQKKGDILARYDDIKEAIISFYLQDLDHLMEEDNRTYERAVRECNGLEPIENAKAYTRIYDWYDKSLDIEQAARECGVTAKEYKEELKAATTGRLVFLYKGRAVPRDIWDSSNSGAYIQSLLLLKRIRIEVTQTVQEVKLPFQAQVTTEWTEVYDSDDKLMVYLAKGIVVKVTALPYKDWFFVEYTGEKGTYKGYVRRKDAKVLQ